MGGNARGDSRGLRQSKRARACDARSMELESRMGVLGDGRGNEGWGGKGDTGLGACTVLDAHALFKVLLIKVPGRAILLRDARAAHSISKRAL